MIVQHGFRQGPFLLRLFDQPMQYHLPGALALSVFYVVLFGAQKVTATPRVWRADANG